MSGGSMKAIRFHPPGGPEKLLFEETAIPTPAPNQVLIEVHAVPIIWPELTWPIYQDAAGNFVPHTPGHDFAGKVVAAGAEVTNPDLQPGKDVVAFTTRRNVEGAMAQFALADADQVVRKPRNLSHVEAASVPLCALTAWQALYDQAKLERGQKVLITGAAGGTGLWMVQVAKYMGAYVVGTGTRQESFDILKQYGVDEVIDVKKNDLGSVTADFDVIIDCIGFDVFKECLKVVKKDGIVVSIVEYNAKEIGEAQGVNSLFFIVSMDAPELDKINLLLESGTLKTKVDSVYQFDDIQSAWAKCLEGHNRGKVVLKIKGE